jgi:glycosyltransferase involved in cell wall biosynthesis
MITKNEAARLGHCLESVKALEPELIVVDTGSTDATADIAMSYGATVVSHDFGFVDFSEARNRALALARGAWILVLDADERLEPASVPRIADLVIQGDNAGYYFERLNHARGQNAPTVDYAVRLFPNRPEYRYQGRVHETIDASILRSGGKLIRTPVQIHHDFSGDSEARRQRNLWYIGILSEEIAANPSDASRLDFLAAEYHQLGMFDQAAEVADRIATIRPLDPEAQLNAGIYNLLHKMDRDRAAAHFAHSLQLRPGYPEAQSFLALAQGPLEACDRLRSRFRPQ